MNARIGMLRYLILLGALASVALILPSPPAYGETYIAGQFGASFPQDLSDIDITTTSSSNLTQSDWELQTSFAFGAKVGHFFRSTPWLGVETEFLISNPNVKKQDVTFFGPGGSATISGFDGTNFRVITWVPLNVVIRLPGRRLQPYAGAGLGVFFARLNDTFVNETQSSTRLGLNAHAGVRYYLLRHWALFAEGKFTGMTRFKFKETANLDGRNADYNAIHGVVGIGYHF